MNKIKILSTIFIVAISLSVLNSCGDDDNPTSGGLVSQLPNQVGMLWTYEVYDSLTQTKDTVSISITDTALSSGQGLLWRTRWHSISFVTENISVINGDTVDFIIDTTFIAPPLERFVFPLTLGNQWEISRNPPASDTSEVTDFGTVTVPAGQFINSALIERKFNDGFEGGYDSSQTWVAPNVGIVSRYFYSIGADGGGGFFVVKNETWELIDYDLSTFSMNQFPSAIGDEWVYELIDSRFAGPDTVTVSIISDLQIDGFDSTRVWLMQGSLITDTQFVSYINNQVWMSEDTVMNSLFDWRYQFPLSVGRNWSGFPIVVAFYQFVIAKESIATAAGNFPSAFNYVAQGGGLNVYWGVDDWLVAGVGVVKRNYWIYDFGPGYSQEWTLLSYKLK